MMTEQTVAKPAETDEQGMARHTWKRRGVIAAGWSAVSAIVARQTPEPVQAGADGDVVFGAGNTTTGITSIDNTSTSNSVALEVVCDGGSGGWGLAATGSGFGVGVSNGGGLPGAAAVYGFTNRADNSGVFGSTDVGVGVLGQSVSGNAIRGQVASGSSANTIAIYGLNNSTYAGPSPGAGGFAIYGLCAKGHGLVGATATAGEPPWSAPPTVSPARMAERFMERVPSAAPSPSSADPRVPRCRTRMAPTAGCIAWRVLKAGSRTSVKARSRADRPRSGSIPTSRPSLTCRSITCSSRSTTSTTISA